MDEVIVMDHLRPFERRVLDLHGEGLEVDEIAAKFRRSPAFVERVISWTRIPRSRPPVREHLSPLERRVLDMRTEGHSHDEIATKFRKGERVIRQVEGLAHFKKGLSLLSRD